jgi:hypothetical protein
MPRRRRLENAVGLLVQRTVGCAMALTVLLVLLRPHDPNIDYRQAWVLVGLVVTLGVAAGAARLLRGPELLRWHPSPPGAGVTWVAAVLTSVIGGVVGFLLARPMRYSYGWDAAVVTGFSRQLSSNGTMSAYALDYLSRYPNNVPLVAMMNVARRLGGSSDAGMYSAYLALNGLSLALVLLLCFALVRMLRGTAAAFVTQAVVFGLVGCSPWMAVPYTDFPAMPFVIGAGLLAVLATRTSRAGAAVSCVVAAFGLTAVAFVIKSTPATTAVAFGCVGLVVALGRPWRWRGRAALVLCCGAVAFGLTTMGGLSLADEVARVPRAELDTSRTPPVTWWLANGLTTTRSLSGRPYYGAYNPQMVNESMKLSGDRLQSWSNHRLEQQVTAMGPAGVATFEVRKQIFNWGDGMFFAWGEGYDFQAKRLQEHDPVARAIQSWQHPNGEHYLLRASLTNGAWLALLLWAGVGLLRARYRRELLVLVVTVLGIAVFTLLFQGRSRYLFAYVPVLIALAAVVSPLRPFWRRRSATPVEEERLHYAGAS